MAEFPLTSGQPLHLLNLLVVRFSLGLLAVSISTGILLTIFIFYISALRVSSRAMYPVSHIAERLMGACLRLERAGLNWGDPDFRSALIADIDVAALVSRQYLFQKFGSTDRATQAWQFRQAHRISAALAEKKTWIMTPKADSREALLRSFSGALVALISGSWDSLELQFDEHPPEGSYEHSGWRQVARQFFHFVRTVIVALVPGVLILTAVRWDLMGAVSPDTLEWAKIGALSWAAFILMLALDPHLSEKMATIKDLSSILRPGSKKD